MSAEPVRRARRQPAEEAVYGQHEEDNPAGPEAARLSLPFQQCAGNVRLIRRQTA